MLPRNAWTTSFRLTRRNTHVVQTQTRLLGCGVFGPSERTGPGRFPSTVVRHRHGGSLTRPQNRWFSLHRAGKIVLRDDAVLDRPDQERHVARQVRQMVFAPVAFLEFLEVHE